MTELCDYLEGLRDRFWLVDPAHPFMQVAALAQADETRDKPKPWTQISLASANGNAPVVFDHALDGAPARIGWQTAMSHLLGFLQFTPGGLVKCLRDSDKAGALVNTAAVMPVGASLAQTLCLALHRAPSAGQPHDDLPAWERPPLTLSDLRGDPVLATGPNDRYTRQSRAVLLELDADGGVRWLRFAAGLALGEDPQQPDPMACYREGSNGLVRVTFSEGRAVWRELPALVPAPQGSDGGSFRPAAVVESAAALQGLIGRSRSHQPLLVAGLASDNAKLLRWRQEQFPLPQSLLTVPDRARELHVHVALSEDLYRKLRALAVELVATTMPEPSRKETRRRAREVLDRGPFTATYFAAAEREVWSMIDRLATDQSDDADALWQKTLLSAARAAWERTINALGMSPQALRAEAHLLPRLNGLLRHHLPLAFAPAPETTNQGA